MTAPNAYPMYALVDSRGKPVPGQFYHKEHSVHGAFIAHPELSIYEVRRVLVTVLPRDAEVNP